MDNKRTIREIAHRVYYKFETTNPYRICQEKGIDILYAPLGSLNAYYTNPYRIPCILINESLDEYEAEEACGHELGHLFLKHNDNKLYFSQRTRMKTTPWEIEANTFLVELKLSAFEPEELQGYTREEIAQIIGVSENLSYLINL